MIAGVIYLSPARATAKLAFASALDETWSLGGDGARKEIQKLKEENEKLKGELARAKGENEKLKEDLRKTEGNLEFIKEMVVGHREVVNALIDKRKPVERR
jgi:chromosome segregation ATPase